MIAIKLNMFDSDSDSDSEAISYNYYKNRSLSNVIDKVLSITRDMINDFHFDRRMGDFRLDSFDYFLYELRDCAKKENISNDYCCYENYDNFVEWKNISILANKDEKLTRTTILLKNILFVVSEELDKGYTKLDKEMYSNLLLLHTIMTTLDLYYNKIENIANVLSERQKNLPK